MKKIVVESIQEFRELRDINEQQVDEGALDFFKGARSLVAQAQKNPENEEFANKALSAAFAKQFGANPKIKDAVLKWDLAKKQELVKMAADKLQDKTIGILKLTKDAEGKLVVAGSKVEGGASTAVSGK